MKRPRWRGTPLLLKTTTTTIVAWEAASTFLPRLRWIPEASLVCCRRVPGPPTLPLLRSLARGRRTWHHPHPLVSWSLLRKQSTLIISNHLNNSILPPMPDTINVGGVTRGGEVRRVCSSTWCRCRNSTPCPASGGRVTCRDPNRCRPAVITRMRPIMKNRRPCTVANRHQSISARRPKPFGNS